MLRSPHLAPNDRQAPEATPTVQSSLDEGGGARVARFVDAPAVTQSARTVLEQP